SGVEDVGICRIKRQPIHTASRETLAGIEIGPGPSAVPGELHLAAKSSVGVGVACGVGRRPGNGLDGGGGTLAIREARRSNRNPRGRCRIEEIVRPPYAVRTSHEDVIVTGALADRRNERGGS